MSRLKHSTVVFTKSFAAALVRSELVALYTPALEPPLCVCAALATVAFLSALVHIWDRKEKEGKRERHM